MRLLSKAPEDELKGWRETEATRIPDLFLHQLSEAKTGSETNTNFPAQFNRAMALDFGLAHPKLKRFLKDIDQTNQTKELKMSMAVTDEKINVFFRTQEKLINGDLDVNFYTTEKEHPDALIYDLTPQPVRFVSRRVGITTKLINEFVYNWQIAPITKIVDLFYRKVIPKPTSPNVLNGPVAHIAFPRYNGLVRAHAFLVPNDDMISLSRAVKANSHFVVRFGLNSGDFFINRDLFTLIIETKRRYKKSHKFEISDVVLGGSLTGAPGSGGFKSTARFDFKCTVDFDKNSGDHSKRSLKVNFTEQGVQVKLGEQECVPVYLSGFNEEVLIPLKTKNTGVEDFRGQMIVWVSPQFVNVQIEEFTGKSKKARHYPKNHRRASRFQIEYGVDVAPHERIKKVQAFGPGSGDDFMHGCPVC